VESGNEPLGYLLSYEEIPPRVDVRRALPTGSYRIQDLEFRDVGFITLSGEVFRHTLPDGSESLGHADLIPGLTRFFDAPAPVQLVDLTASADAAAGDLD
jgi:hypothetical protein